MLTRALIRRFLIAVALISLVAILAAQRAAPASASFPEARHAAAKAHSVPL